LREGSKGCTEERKFILFRKQGTKSKRGDLTKSTSTYRGRLRLTCWQVPFK